MKQDRVPDDQQRGRSPRLLFVANISFSFIHNRLALAQAAQAAGYEVHLATRVWRAEDRERIQKAGMQLHPIEIGRGDSGLFYDLRSLWYLHRLYRSLQPDLVHHLAMKPIVFGGLAARFSGVRMVVQAFTGLGYAFIGGTVFSALRNILVILALRVGCRRAGFAISARLDSIRDCPTAAGSATSSSVSTTTESTYWTVTGTPSG